MIYDLSELHMQTLDGVSDIDYFSHFRWVGKKRNDLLPLAFPDQSDGRIYLTPQGPLGKIFQRGKGRLGILSPIDRSQLSSHRLNIGHGPTTQVCRGRP
jgi:hypothetical protein